MENAYFTDCGAQSLFNRQRQRAPLQSILMGVQTGSRSSGYTALALYRGKSRVVSAKLACGQQIAPGPPFEQVVSVSVFCQSADTQGLARIEHRPPLSKMIGPGYLIKIF